MSNEEQWLLLWKASSSARSNKRMTRRTKIFKTTINSENGHQIIRRFPRFLWVEDLIDLPKYAAGIIIPLPSDHSLEGLAIFVSGRHAAHQLRSGSRSVYRSWAWDTHWGIYYSC